MNKKSISTGCQDDNTSKLLKNRVKHSAGFTILEVMLAISIFGLLLLYASQLMRQEIRLFNNAMQQNELEHKTRTAMMHLLDQTRLHPAKYLVPLTQPDSGVYYMAIDPNGGDDIPVCLIDQNPSLDPNFDPATNVTAYPLPLESGVKLNGIYFDQARHKLWYWEPKQYSDPTQGGKSYLIADQVDSLTLEEADSHLLKLGLTVKDPQTLQSYQLITWVRLY